MYFCGPTVYQRIHVGNARPFVISMWLRRWLERRLRGDARPEHHRRQRQDLRRCARRSARARRARRPLVHRGHRRSRARPARREPKATETIPEIVALIEELVARELAYAVDGDVYFRVARFPEYGAALAPAARRDGGRRSRTRARRIRATSRSGRRRSRARTRRGTRPGAGPAGLAHRVLGDGREAPRAGVRDPRRRARPRLPAPRERACPVARRSAASSPGSGCTTGMLGFGGEKMSKSLGNIVTLREALDEWGRGDAARLLPARALAQADRLHRRARSAQAAAQAEAFATSSARRRSRLRRRVGAIRGVARRRLQHAGRARRPPRAGATTSLLDARARRFGLASLAQSPRRPRRSSSSLPQREAGTRAQATSRRRTSSATRSPPLGWEVRDGADGFQLVPRVTRELVYGRRAVREALRGPRAVLELHVSERALAAEPWLRRARPTPQRPSPSATLTRARRHARPPGRRRLLRAVPLRGRVRARRREPSRSSSASTASPTRTISARSAAARRGRARRASSCRRDGSARVTRRSAARRRVRSSTCRWRS